MPRKKGNLGRKAEPDGQIKELVGAIIKYKNFKQLAEYNMSCLLQKITPPAAGWEDAVKEVVAQDGLETIVDVLKKQKGNASILATASKTLCRLAVNPSISNKLAATGGIGAALASLEFMGDDDDDNSQDALENTVVLLEQVAASAPEAVVASGAMENVLSVMQKQGLTNEICMEACVRTLERCSRTSVGLGEIVQKNGVPVLLGTFRDASTSAGATMPGLKLMDRVCRLEQYTEYVNQCGGIETMVMLLSNKSENAQVVKQGGRLLSKIAKTQLSETMAKLNNSNLDPAVKMTTLNLLSSLALEDESAEKIVADGGIGTLLADLADDNIDETMVITESKFLGRLMTSNKNVSEMIESGGVDTIIGLASKNTDNEAVMESLIPALVQMVAVSEDPSAIVSTSGVTGVKMVIDTMTSNPGFGASSEAGIKLISKMATSKKKDNKPELIQVRR